MKDRIRKARALFDEINKPGYVLKHAKSHSIEFQHICLEMGLNPSTIVHLWYNWTLENNMKSK